MSITKAQTKKLQGFKTTSAKIRLLDDAGMSRGDIGRYLKIRYQFVRGVLESNVKTPTES